MSAFAAVLAWILTAVQAWGANPIPMSERFIADEVRERVAESIVQVAYDADEPPVSSGPFARARTALLLTSIFALETRFVARVITGHCTKPECDNGSAWGLPQLHVGRFGFRLVGDGFAYCLRRSADCYSANELVDDWALQVKAGLHIYRTQGLRAYSTGPAATTQAKTWMASHPPPVSDAEVMVLGGT